jgi:hypothetical protein
MGFDSFRGVQCCFIRGDAFLVLVNRTSRQRINDWLAGQVQMTGQQALVPTNRSDFEF